MSQERTVRPAHYKHGGIETIDYMRAISTPEEFYGFCKLNVLKYVGREGFKNGIEDLKKALTYLEWAIEEAEKKKASTVIPNSKSMDLQKVLTDNVIKDLLDEENSKVSKAFEEAMVGDWVPVTKKHIAEVMQGKVLKSRFRNSESQPWVDSVLAGWNAGRFPCCDEATNGWVSCQVYELRSLDSTETVSKQEETSSENQPCPVTLSSADPAVLEAACDAVNEFAQAMIAEDKARDLAQEFSDEQEKGQEKNTDVQEPSAPQVLETKTFAKNGEEIKTCRACFGEGWTMSPDLSKFDLAKETGPDKQVAGSSCIRCRGTGYVWVNTFAPDHSYVGRTIEVKDSETSPWVKRKLVDGSFPPYLCEEPKTILTGSKRLQVCKEYWFARVGWEDSLPAIPHVVISLLESNGKLVFKRHYLAGTDQATEDLKSQSIPCPSEGMQLTKEMLQDAFKLIAKNLGENFRTSSEFPNEANTCKPQEQETLGAAIGDDLTAISQGDLP